jgi:hypothetical protein
MDTSGPGFRKEKSRTIKTTVCAVSGVAEGMDGLKPGTYILIALSLALMIAGCGAPGEPLPPTPPIPTAITDLSAVQAGDGAMLSFTMPKRSVVGDTLTEVPTMEIQRGALLPDGTPDPKSFRIVDTVPGAMMASYTQKGTVHFPDPVAPEEIQVHPWATVVYRVRARVTDKKVSADSNNALVKLFVVAPPVENLRANLTANGIELAWTVAKKTPGGGAGAGIEQYHVYRGEIDPASAEAVAKDLGRATWKAPLVQIASVETSEYRDSGFDYGKTYVYVVRATLRSAGEGLESNNSNSVILTPKDTFPPAAPQGVIAAVLPAAEGGKSVVDLSWSINVEADLAGYRVYRGEKQGERGVLITPDLLATPAYRDSNVATGQRYWYTVTAVDRAGNESAPSEQMVVEMTQPST